MIQYGIVHWKRLDELHRGPMTLEEADEWIKDWAEMGGTPEAFLIVHRCVSDWELGRSKRPNHYRLGDWDEEG